MAKHVATSRKTQPIVPISDEEKQYFLEKDFCYTLTWLFVGAVTWTAAKTQPERCCHQAALGMFTTLVQARALYEFFYNRASTKDDDARAYDFSRSWNEAQSSLYNNYMSGESPANKRVFHLVFGRDKHSGGQGQDGPDHLKEQVIEFAKELRGLTQVFIEKIDPAFRNAAESALEQAL